MDTLDTVGYQAVATLRLPQKLVRERVPAVNNLFFIGNNSYASATHWGGGAVIYHLPKEYNPGVTAESFVDFELTESTTLGFVPITEEARALLERKGIQPYL
ncbi:MAG: hypothetical protein HY831_04100 [Candidatus Aenigmarchaeota archaeon]|nr:hypothetical protein [Candidatus Aenigmarchaeota archaeon]